MVTENKLFDVTVHFQVEAPDLEHAIEKAADYTYRLPKDKKVEIFDSKTQESVASEDWQNLGDSYIKTQESVTSIEK